MPRLRRQPFTVPSREDVCGGTLWKRRNEIGEVRCNESDRLRAEVPQAHGGRGPGDHRRAAGRTVAARTGDVVMEAMAGAAIRHGASAMRSGGGQRRQRSRMIRALASRRARRCENRKGYRRHQQPKQDSSENRAHRQMLAREPVESGAAVLRTTASSQPPPETKRDARRPGCRKGQSGAPAHSRNIRIRHAPGTKPKHSR